MTGGPSGARPWWKAPAVSLGITGLLVAGLIALRFAKPAPPDPIPARPLVAAVSRPVVSHGALVLDGRETLASGTRPSRGTFVFSAPEAAELTFGDGTRLRLEAGAEGLLGHDLVRLQRGVGDLVCPSTGGMPFRVTTPRGDLVGRQAAFRLSVSGAGVVTVAVGTGTVEILKPSGQTDRVVSGGEAWVWQHPVPAVGSDSVGPLPGTVMDSPVGEVDPRSAP